MTDVRAFYDRRAPFRPRESEREYHHLLKRHYAFLIPPKARVIEFGSGIGNLLEAVKPSLGVGVDVSPEMVTLARQRHPGLRFEISAGEEFSSEEKFDYLIASDLVNDLPDVQHFLESIKRSAHENSRLVLNFYNYAWRPILAAAERMGSKAPTRPQNWLSRTDLENLLHLAGWEMIKTDTRILWPARTWPLDYLLNRWVAPFFPHFCLSIFMVARPKPVRTDRHYKCSVVIPARNEEGNIEAAVLRTPELGLGTEIIFVEGHSKDGTWNEIQRVKEKYPQRDIKVLKQKSKGKGGAVREAYAIASGDILFILDADLTVPPEDLPKFYEVARTRTADFVNGVRLVYPMEDQAMRFFNIIGNKFFSFAFTWLLGQRIKDTLCGTKVLFKSDYDALARNRNYFGEFDPFGDFDLLFGAAKLNLRIIDLPVRYKARTYGDTNISRWKHGWLLLRMVWFAARRLKFLR